MGFTFSTLLDKMFEKTKIKSVLFGLDQAGKTVLLYKLLLQQIVDVVPTIGFNVETINHNETEFILWDLGGQPRIRQVWHHYYLNATKSIIFVVDSNDREKIGTAKEELNRLLVAVELKDSVLLVLANKQDLQGAMSVEEIAEKLGLESIKNRKWKIQGNSVYTGAGIYEGLNWIKDSLPNQTIMEKIKNICPKRRMSN